MKPSRKIEDFLRVMAALRTPVTGCPWDLRQDFASIVSFTIEEAYEVADAIERADLVDLKDELGDLLLQVVFHSRMAEEQVKLDQLQVKVDKARALHQSLERERAELRSPVHLGREAATMKMSAADAVGFVTVDAQTYTEVLATSAAMPLDEPGTRP